MKSLWVVLLLFAQWGLMEWAWSLWYEPFDREAYETLLHLSSEIKQFKNRP